LNTYNGTKEELLDFFNKTVNWGFVEKVRLFNTKRQNVAAQGQESLL